MVASRDGTEVGWETVGEGPHVVFVHGGVSDRNGWRLVADRLGGYTRHLLDRRGRGLSAREESPYSFEREYEDIAAVAAALDGPVHLVGHSSGAICVLGAALQSSDVASVSVYEPPLPVARKLPADVIDEMQHAVDAGQRADAARIGLRGIAELPAEVADRMAGDERRQGLIHTWARECLAINELPSDADRYSEISVPALLLVGSETSDYQRAGVHALAEAVPHAEVVVLEGQGHVAVATAPDLVASALASFLDRL